MKNSHTSRLVRKSSLPDVWKHVLSHKPHPRPTLEPMTSTYSTNRLARLRYETGKSTVLKSYTSSHSAQTERLVLLALEHHGLDGAVPRIRNYFEYPQEYPEWHIVEMDFLPGNALPLAHDRQRHQTARLIGDLLRRIHLICAEPKSWGPFGASPPKPVSWFQFLQVLLQKRSAILLEQGIIPAQWLDPIYNELAAAEKYLNRVSAPSILHCDLNASNILVSNKGTPCLLDFERSIQGHWIYDTVKLFWNTFEDCTKCTDAFGVGYGFDVHESEFLEISHLYRLIYCVDMGAYLVKHLNTPPNRKLMKRLLNHIQSSS